MGGTIELKTTAKRGQSQGGRRGINQGQFLTLQQQNYVSPSNWGFGSAERPGTTKHSRYVS